MMYKKYQLLFLVFFLNLTYGYSTVILPSVLSDNMVLQRNSSITLWGKTENSLALSVLTSWDNKKYPVIVNNKGMWDINIKTPDAGGPYFISFDDGERTVLNDILIGEVWLCSGQSNMEMPLKGFTTKRGEKQPILNSKSIIAKADNEKLRIYHVKRNASYRQTWDTEGEWKTTNSENAPEFSALAFQYGQMLQEKLKVPVGIIVASWSSTPIQAWMGSSVNNFEKQLNFSRSRKRFSLPTVLFKGMIKPLAKYNLKGFIWYQGENDRFYPEDYGDKLEGLAEDWRTQWNLGKIPFYFVQIAPWVYNEEGRSSAARLREEQLKASQQISKSAMVVTLDIGSKTTIHPPDKTTVAERLLACALNNTYGFNVPFEGPEYKSMGIKGQKIQLKFKNSDGLVLKDSDPRNFEIAGADGVFHSSKVLINADGIEVWSKDVTAPIAVRYGFKDFAIGNLYNKDGFPASPFRTDNWPIVLQDK